MGTGHGQLGVPLKNVLYSEICFLELQEPSASLAIREVHSKAFLRFYLTPVRMTDINQTNNKCQWRMWGKSPYLMFVGVQTGIDTIKIKMEACPNTENSTSAPRHVHPCACAQRPLSLVRERPAHPCSLPLCSQ